MVRTLRLCMAALVLSFQASVWVSAQGLDTRASKDDWEEINFEYNSSVLVDGFPSLLRLAELLQANPGYRVRVEGHTDGIGSDSFNERLGQARANTVRDFLVKYGANANQIQAVSRGKSDPKVANPNPRYQPTDEPRYMNRRVVLTVMDEQGRTVGAGGPGEAIRALNAAPQAGQPAQAGGVTDCCSEVLKRLDRLDDIARMLKDLADQNAELRRQIDGLRQSQQALESKVNQPPPEAPKPPSANEVAGAVTQQLEAQKTPKFQLLGANVGADNNGDVTFTGKGRYFTPFGERYGFQAQMEYFYMHGQREGQGDVGLVDRVGKNFQAGLFASFKHVTLAGNQTGGTLGQGAVAFDYLFSRGRIGIFGTKGFLDNALINRTNALDLNGNVLRNTLEERYLKIVDQAGVSATIALWGKNYAEGNLGYLKSTVYGDHLGGTVRLIFPINDKIAFTAEGGANETLLTAGNTGRAVFGIQFGNVIRPKEYLTTDHALPMQVPRVQYEVLTKRVRTGNDPPVADAGPNLSNVPAGLVTLDGSNSYDPDGDPITFQWTQEAGTTVTLSAPTSAKTTFTAAAGEFYSFRLTVKDDHGGQSQARVTISTKSADRVSIVFFNANPTQIQAGQLATLSWNVLNADTVMISGIGTVASSGATSVSPAETTTYTLTARNSVNEQTLTATVVVTPVPPVQAGPQPQLLSCFVTPTNIVAGETATLNWTTVNANSVTISPDIGSVAQNGNIPVSPAATTIYTITAAGASGTTAATCNTSVTVSAGTVPRILRFSAIPATITAGQPSTLLWAVENADTVSISSIGNVSLTGTQDVTPSATTTYTLTATNATGNTTATATVTVNPVSGGQPPTIVSFTANPQSTPTPGTKVTLACTANDANFISIAGTVFNQSSASLDVFPQETTTYACVASNASGNASSTVTVTVGGGGGGGGGPIVVTNQSVYTNSRYLSLDASGSFSPTGDAPLTYFWSSVDGRAAIQPSTPTPSVFLNLGTGPWVFEVTVTDSKGKSATAQVTVRLVDAP
jgi:K319L-like, PKD domain/OmpA family